MASEYSFFGKHYLASFLDCEPKSIINVEGLKPEQIKEIQAMVEALKAKNQTNKNGPEIDMIEYLLENPIHVDKCCGLF